jgi:hypothetical protein
VVLVDLLCANADIFAWSPSDVPSILREVAEHSLDILLTPAPCSNGYAALTKSGVGQSEWTCRSSSSPDSSRKCSTLRG